MTASKMIVIIITVIFAWVGNIYPNGEIEEAKTLAGSGKYREAYERLLPLAENLQIEITNLQGIVKYYKNELTRVDAPPREMDYAYNEAANRLWSSAWSLQHDGVFKKTGREKDEYLQKAVDTYRQIVINYPLSAKAEDAQYRMGRIYYKFIKDYKLAEHELQRYMNMYPRGKFASSAQQILLRINRD